MVVNRGVEVRDVLSQLEAIPFFAGLDREQLIAIKDRSFIRKYRNNEVIIYENEPCIGLFIFLSGSAKIFKTSKDGREQVLYFLGAGDSFGEVPIFDGGGNPITLLAMEDSYVMIIEKDDFRKIATENSLVALRTIESLSNRVRKLFSLVEDLSFNDVGKRLARLLLDMAEEKGVPKGKGVTIDLNMTHQEIAAVVGTVREMVSRSLKKLEKGHVIRSNGGEMEILDIEKLRALV
ncbi:MAG: Crp/Fnr family transcriptional regulator, partial [Nitrospirota bacterium]|nr:Crp/Fnr family transcriptional regulator [Nitrospirota bacterium]